MSWRKALAWRIEIDGDVQKTMKVETLCQTATQLDYFVRLVPNDGGESIEIEG